MSANTMETDICDRIHAINRTEPKINAVRYFPTSLSRVQLPLVVALPGAATYGNSGTQLIDVTRNFLLQCAVGDWNEGILTETAQKHSEDLLSIIREMYGFRRLRLDLDRQPLPGVNKSILLGDGGIINIAGKATIVFTLEVNYRHSNR